MINSIPWLTMTIIASDRMPGVSDQSMEDLYGYMETGRYPLSPGGFGHLIEQATTLGDMVVVLDSGLREENAALAQLHPRSVYQRADFPWNYSALRNQAVYVAEGLGSEWVGILDMDERYQEGMIPEIRQYLRARPGNVFLVKREAIYIDEDEPRPTRDPWKEDQQPQLRFFPAGSCMFDESLTFGSGFIVNGLEEIRVPESEFHIDHYQETNSKRRRESFYLDLFKKSRRSK